MLKYALLRDSHEVATLHAQHPFGTLLLLFLPKSDPHCVYPTRRRRNALGAFALKCPRGDFVVTLW